MVEPKNIPRALRKRGLEEKLQKLCEENDVVFMAIFGSFVRGEQRKRSDVDLLIRFKKDSGKTLLDVVDIEEKFRRAFGRKVDLVEVEGLNKYIRDEVLDSMRVIYEER